MYIYGRFMLRFDRIQQNSVKQLSFNKKTKQNKNQIAHHELKAKKVPTAWRFALH